MKQCTELQKIKFKNSLVKKGDCLEWVKSKMPNGYGHLKIGSRTTNDSKKVLAHRLAYYIEHNEIDAKLMVCHTCDNRACCNPNHLYLGTAKDNAKDMIDRGRQVIPSRKFENNGRAILTKENVKLIRDKEMTAKEVISLFNIGKTQAYRIIKNEQWVGI